MLLRPEYQNPLHRSTPFKMDRGAVTVSFFNPGNLGGTNRLAVILRFFIYKNGSAIL